MRLYAGWFRRDVDESLVERETGGEFPVFPHPNDTEESIITRRHPVPLCPDGFRLFLDACRVAEAHYCHFSEVQLPFQLRPRKHWQP